MSASPAGHQSQVTTRCLLSSSCKNCCIIQVHQLLPGGDWQSGARQSECAKVAPMGILPQRAPLQVPIIVPNQKPALLSKLQDKQIGLLHRKTGGVFLSAVCEVP